MNEAEKIKKQLARYETLPVHTEVAEESAPAKESGDIWGSAFELPDWKTEPQYVKEEPDYSKGFQVGDFWPKSRWSDGHLERQAIPHPNYEGKPGDLITPEMNARYWERWLIWFMAVMALDRLMRIKTGNG